MSKSKTSDPVESFIARFQAKANALPHEYLLMQTAHYVWILAPRRNGERKVACSLNRATHRLNDHLLG